MDQSILIYSKMYYMALITKKKVSVYCFDIIKYIIIELYKSITF